LLRTGERPTVSAPVARPKSSGNNGSGQPGTTKLTAQLQSAAAPEKQKPASEGTNGRKDSPSASSAQAASAAQERAAPLARSNVVRENSNTLSAVAAQEMLEQKAKSHPVVQEVMRTFTVKNIQVNPKRG
jgi:hypothetical protein